ncbi:MAG: hypothetical protein ACR2GJ_03300 [Gemmatimonadaceae bacterium]
MKKALGIAAIALIALAGCSESANRAPDRSPEDSPAAAANPESTAAAAPSCGAAGATLTADGIGRLRVGARVSEVREACRVVSDETNPGSEGMAERRIAVTIGDAPVDAVVVDDRIWRVHVETGDFRTADGLGVGTTVADLRDKGNARVLAGEGSMFMTLASHCGLSFRLGGVPFGPERSAAELPAGGRVVEVLAMGCESPRP